MANTSRNAFFTSTLFFSVFLVVVQAIYSSAYTGIKTRTYQRDPIIDQQQQYQENDYIGSSSSSSSSSRANYQTTPQRLSDYNTNNQNNNNHIQDHNSQRQTNYDSQQQQQQEPLYQRSYQGGQAQPLRTVGTTWSDAENSITEYFTGCPADYTGQLPYAYDCRRFLNCWRGRGHIQTCAPGTVFNPETLECDRPDKVLCGVNGGLAARIPQQETPLAALKIEPQSNSATKYRAGRLTDTTNQHARNICAPGVSGLIPLPSDCTKFVNCANGNMHIQQCGPGTAFSPTMQVCDFKHKVNCGERPLSQPESNAAVNDQRESKAYQSSSQASNQWQQHRQQTQGHNAENNRWSNMNRQRPDPNSFGHQDQHYQQPNVYQQSSNPTWSGSSTSINPQAPTEHLLYEEGSLRPGHVYGNNRKTYSAQLAPFSPTKVVNSTTRQTPTSTQSTNLYFAQPLGSQEDSAEAFTHNNNQRIHHRTNSSRNIPFSSSNSNRWIPITPKTTTETNRFYQPRPLPSPPYQEPAANTFEAVNVPNRHLMPPLPTDIGQQPLTESEYPTNNQNGQFDILNNNRGYDQLPSNSDNTYTIDESKLFGGPQPPKKPFQIRPNHYDTTPPTFTSTTAYNEQVPNRKGHYPDIEPSVPLTPLKPISSTPQSYYPSITPTQAATTPTSYLLPPKPPTTPLNSISPMHSHISNATKKSFDRDPHYSPSYSAVVHSSNANWSNKGGIDDHQKPQIDNYDPQPNSVYNNFVSTSTTRTQNFSPDSLYPGQNLLSTTEKRGSSPPPYNREYYNQNRETTDENDTDVGQLPLSDALRLLLKPYTNRNMSEDAAAEAESNIMNIFSKATTTLATDLKTTEDAYNSITPSFKPSHTTTTSIPSSYTKLNKSDTVQTSDMDDVELILAGEQHSLSIKPTEPTQILKTDFHLNQTRPSNVPNNWPNQHYHSRDYHARHPNLLNPFEADQNSKTDSTTINWHHHKHHNHHHNHEQNHHSREFHSRHPNLPNPFTKTTREGDSSFVDKDLLDIPNPNAEATTISYDIRGGFNDDDCEYDCGNGKCIKTFEICDGVNNCGNRKDESQCDHLGYKVRLTGGETPNAGRIEVKIRDKWGYVCDDKFGLRDADVVCKELGFEYGASEVRGSSYYPPLEVNFAYAMDEVDCVGNETALKDCDFKGWGINNCGHDEVVGVVCKVPLLKCPNDYWLCSTSKECIPPAFVCDNTPDCSDKSDESDAVCNSPVEYRLEGGRSAIEGRLEIKYRGVWGTICDDDFGQKEAQVACNSLGYYGKPEIKKNIFGPGNGPIWLDQVSCYGHEDAIDKCNHWTWGEHNCNHTEDVGLRCTAGPPPRKTTKSTVYPPVEEEFHSLDGQTTLEDIGIYSNSWARSSKALNIEKRCGRFKTDLIDEYEHPEERVINGTVAKRGRYPWQATIRTKGRAGISSHWCGAVLISKKHLLTAAHCLAGYPKGAYFIRLGDHYANIAESSETDSYIENWYLHEKFRDQTHMNNDIALIVLKTPVKYNDYIQPICLPEKGAPLETGRMCTISGWGSIKSGVSTPSNILRAAQLPILADNVCKQRQVYGNSMTEGMFCAGAMDESVDACDGDSGGPLVCEDAGAEILYGIISWGQHCGYANKPGVYVRVEKYIDWIYEKINFSLQQSDHK